ncbi:MAG: NACHT domain-containing protein, partial [Acidobacteriota bacterium]
MDRNNQVEQSVNIGGQLGKAIAYRGETLKGIKEIKEIFDKTYASLSLKDVSFWTRYINKKYDFVGAAQKYKKRLDERYDNIKLFGKSQPLKLRSIYTQVNIVEKVVALRHTSIEELEQYFERNEHKAESKSEVQDGIKAVNKLSKIVLLGKPGAGKTTFLKYIALQAVDGLLEVDRIPIYISLKDWSDSNRSLIDFIVQQF